MGQKTVCNDVELKNIWGVKCEIAGSHPAAFSTMDEYVRRQNELNKNINRTFVYIRLYIGQATWNLDFKNTQNTETEKLMWSLNIGIVHMRHGVFSTSGLLILRPSLEPHFV